LVSSVATVTLFLFCTTLLIGEVVFSGALLLDSVVVFSVLFGATAGRGS